MFKKESCEDLGGLSDGFYKKTTLPSTLESFYASLLTRNSNEIIRYAYQNNKLFKIFKFFSFDIHCFEKVLQSKLGDYRYSFFGRSQIRIFSIQCRSYSEVLITTIHELSHHIDFCLRGKSGHDKAFYDIYKHLLYAAIALKMLSLTYVTDIDHAKKSRSVGRQKLARMMLADPKKKSLSFNSFQQWVQLCLDYMDAHDLFCAQIPSSYRSPDGHYPGRWLKRALAKFDSLRDEQRLHLLLFLNVCPVSSNVCFADISLSSVNRDLSRKLIADGTALYPFVFKYSWPTNITSFVGVLVARRLNGRVLYCYFRSLDGTENYILPVYFNKETGLFSPRSGAVSFADNVLTGMIFSCNIYYSKTGRAYLENADYLGFCSCCQFWNSYFQERLQSQQEKLRFLQQRHDFEAAVAARKIAFLTATQKRDFHFIKFAFVTKEQLANLLTMFSSESVIQFFNITQGEFDRVRRAYGLLYTLKESCKWYSISIPIEELVRCLNQNAV